MCVNMTCKDNELYLPKNKKTTTTTTMENYFRTGHEKQEIVCFSITTPFYDTRGGSRFFLRGGAKGRGVNNRGLGVATKYCP